MSAMTDALLGLREIGPDPYGTETPVPDPSTPTNEAEFQRCVIAAAHNREWMTYHTHDSRRSAPGYPDLTLAHRKWGLLFVELKMPKGKVSADQKEWLKILRQCGQEAMVWRPADWGRILLVLDGTIVPMYWDDYAPKEV